MALVRYWFDELHRKADQYQRRGYELVSVGFDHRKAWNAGPFMVFNPTTWEGARRKLLAPTAVQNPRRWVTIQIRSQTRPLRTWQAPGIPGRGTAAEALRPAVLRRLQDAPTVDADLEPALYD